MIQRTVVFAFLINALALANLKAGDWPRLGGPNGAGISAETGLLRAWPTNGPTVLWTADVGDGFAGPAVWDGEVYLLDRVPDERDILRCFDLATGRELWQFAYDAPGTLGNNNGSRNVPTVDADHVFILGPMGHFLCIDRHTHNPIWSVHLVNDFKDPTVDTAEPAQSRQEKLLRAQVPLWGLTQAPLLYKDLVIVAPQTQKTGLVAYEVATGKLRWRSDYIGRNWYSHVSPTLVTLCGVDQVIMLAQPSDPEKSPDKAPPAIISSINPNSGQILWTNQTPGPDKIPIPQPLPIGDDRLFLTSGYTLGSLILQVTHSSDQWQSQVLVRNQGVAGHIQSPILYNGRIYLTSFKEHGATNTGLVCLNTNCETLWQTGPSQQFDSGGYLIADGMLFIMNGKNGQLSLFDLADTQPKRLASAKVLDAKNENAWAPMALSNGKLVVRDRHQMKCLDVKSAH